jgi:hypothetical protein
MLLLSSRDVLSSNKKPRTFPYSSDEKQPNGRSQAFFSSVKKASEICHNVLQPVKKILAIHLSSCSEAMACEMGQRGALFLATTALVVVALSVAGQLRHHDNGFVMLEEAPKNLPRAFAEEAERTRIETAIRRAAAALERAETKVQHLEREYTSQAAKAEADRKQANDLLRESKTAATGAVKQRAEYKVAESKAETEEKTVNPEPSQMQQEMSSNGEVNIFLGLDEFQT